MNDTKGVLTDPPAASAPADTALTRAVEAILFTSDRPVTTRRLAEALGLVEADPEEAAASADTSDPGATGTPPAVVVRRRKPSADRPDPAAAIDAAVASLNEAYAATGRVFRIESVSGGYRVMTRPELAPVLASFHRAAPAHRLSRAAVETLAIIAYRQPMTRAQLEAIRGVSCGEVLRSLMERRLITIKGRAEELGRPILYGTTKEFLDAFGLASLKDLPTPAEVAVS